MRNHDYDDFTRIFCKSHNSRVFSNINPNIINSRPGATNIQYIIESLSVPKTYYNIYNVQLINFINSVSDMLQISFINGNYTIDEFFDRLTSQMTFLDPGVTYTWQVDNITDLVQISSTSGQYSLEFISSPLNRYVGAILNKQYDSDTQVIVFDYPSNFERTMNFIISSNLRSVNRLSYDNIIVEATLNSGNNIVAVCPCRFETNLDQPELEMHRTFYGTTSPYIITGSMIQSPLMLELRDDDFELIDLNGSYWTASICFYLQL